MVPEAVLPPVTPAHDARLAVAQCEGGWQAAPGNSTRNLRGMGQTLVAFIVKPMSWFDSSLVMPAVHHVDPQASCHGPAFAALQEIVECQCLTPLPSHV